MHERKAGRGTRSGHLFILLNLHGCRHDSPSIPGLAGKTPCLKVFSISQNVTKRGGPYRAIVQGNLPRRGHAMPGPRGNSEPCAFIHSSFTKNH